MLVVAGVVTGELAEQLIPHVEALGHVPDSLCHREHLVVAWQVRHHPVRGPQAQHAVVVVHAHELALRVDHDVGGHREERRRSIEGVADEGRWPLAIPEEL